MVAVAWWVCDEVKCGEVEKRTSGGEVAMCECVKGLGWGAGEGVVGRMAKGRGAECLRRERNEWESEGWLRDGFSTDSTREECRLSAD